MTSPVPYRPKSQIAARFLRGAEGEVLHPSERIVLQLIWNFPALARSELTDHTDLSQQSIYRIIDQLCDRGIVKLGPAKPGIGRGQPSPTLKLDGSFAYSCGISVNTDIIGLCIIDLAGTMIGESTVSLIGLSMMEALERVRAELSKLQAKHYLSEEAFFGIGFAISGYHVGGTRFNSPLPLHEWSLIELGPLLSDFFGKPVWTHNSANTAAIAEATFGVGRDIKHFAYLSFNYGFGGGLISNGELLPGGNGNAASYSRMYGEDENNLRPALQFLIERLGRHGVDIPSITYMKKHFDRNWPGVAEWVNDILPGYNRLIAGIRAIFDPQAIVLGGQIPTDLANILIEKTVIHDRTRYGVSPPGPKLIISKIESDASAMGAAITPFRAIFY